MRALRTISEPPGRFRRDGAHPPTAVEARRNATLLSRLWVQTIRLVRTIHVKDTIQSVTVAATHYRFKFTRIVHGLAYR